MNVNGYTRSLAADHLAVMNMAMVVAYIPVALSGRANSTFNLIVLGAFGLQWGMGVLIDILQASGYSIEIAHRNAFVVHFVLQAVAVWIMIGAWRTPAKAD